MRWALPCMIRSVVSAEVGLPVEELDRLMHRLVRVVGRPHDALVAQPGEAKVKGRALVDAAHRDVLEGPPFFLVHRSTSSSAETTLAKNRSKTSSAAAWLSSRKPPVQSFGTTA